jgi:hypothetical protein
VGRMWLIVFDLGESGFVPEARCVISSGVVEGFSWTAMVRDAAVGRGLRGCWGGLLVFLLAAFREGFVGLALTPAEVRFVAAEALEFHGAGLQGVSAE